MRSRSIRTSLFYCFTLTLFSCAFPHEAKDAGEHPFLTGEKAFVTAETMLGKPYKFQGELPSGFDCSGLVRYCYLAAGMDVPHGTSELKEATQHVEYRNVRKGDLVFFDRDGKKYSHVGIYVGDDRFVHAPSLGKAVRIDSLQDPYWKQHFCDARRF